MEDESDGLIYLGGGSLAALLLGMAFVPFRGFTTASNFTFAFMALTIVVAEYGGRWAAVATALCSGLSLNFFLTKPYLTLVIEDKHDLIAFVGLTACGLVAAALGSQRSERIAALGAARRHLALLHSALLRLEEAGPVEPRAMRILDASRLAFPLAAVVVRDTHGHVVAASERAHAMAPPAQVLETETLLPPGTAAGELAHRSPPLPVEGGRLALVSENRQIGWLDVWGNGAPASAPCRRALSDLARLLAALLADLDRGPGRAAGRPSA